MSIFKDSWMVFKTIIRDCLWVTETFGFRVGGRFFFRTTFRNIKQLFLSRREDRFENLTDVEARSCAWAFGLYKWENRKDLNRQWKALLRSMQRQ